MNKAGAADPPSLCARLVLWGCVGFVLEVTKVDGEGEEGWRGGGAGLRRGVLSVRSLEPVVSGPLVACDGTGEKKNGQARLGPAGDRAVPNGARVEER